MKTITKESGEYEITETEVEKTETDRGFGLIKFVDRYNTECSLQDSSLATEPAIWLGVDNADPQIMKSGEGWKPYPIPEEVLLKTRMHLTQAMVIQLLPYLKEFAETGKYIAQMEKK